MKLTYTLSEQEQLINLAYNIAEEAHAGQFSKDGEPYITHIDAVSKIVASEYHTLITQLDAAHTIYVPMKAFVIMAAILHDTIEDTYVTDEFLREKGIPEMVICMVKTVTKQEGDTYFDFTMRIHGSGDVGAKLVKLADLTHNMSDLKEGAMKDKYRFAYYIISDFTRP